MDNTVPIFVCLVILVIFGCFIAYRVESAIRDNCITYASDMTVTEANKFCDNVLYGKKK